MPSRAVGLSRPAIPSHRRARARKVGGVARAGGQQAGQGIVRADRVGEITLKALRDRDPWSSPGNGDVQKGAA